VSGATFIYASGYAGTQSAIYSIGLAADASKLDAPQVASTMLPGEICRGLVNYQGFIVALLDQGVRFGQADTSGALTFGALIPTTSPVLCGTTWDRFIWYGLTNYDTLSTGLGRLDPRTFTSDLTPAYASDLMATAQGAVTSTIMFNGVHYFAVAGQGVWEEQNTPVASGTITSGRITYDLSRITLHVWAAPRRVRTINVPLLFNESITVNGTEQPFDCAAAEAKINELLDAGRYVNFQSANRSTRAFVFDTNFIRLKMTSDRLGHEGTLVVTLREL
jgi:hypothetical protein